LSVSVFVVNLVNPHQQWVTPSPALLIEKLSPRLPGESDPGVFKGSGPGNDGGTETKPPCVSYLIKLMASYKQQLTYNQ
ncbi:MAG: hypothetical protein R6V55_15205, partial [Desulfovermiculus sp.]